MFEVILSAVVYVGFLTIVHIFFLGAFMNDKDKPEDEIEAMRLEKMSKNIEWKHGDRFRFKDNSIFTFIYVAKYPNKDRVIYVKEDEKFPLTRSADTEIFNKNTIKLESEK